MDDVSGMEGLEDEDGSANARPELDAAALRDREMRNALEVDGLGGRRHWGISSESSQGRRGPGPAASRGRGTRHRSLTSDGGQWQCALHDDDGCGVLARIH